jgi:DNA-binding phage protein
MPATSADDVDSSRSVLADPEVIRAAAADLVADIGVRAAAYEIGVSREALLGVLSGAGYPSRRGTLAIFRVWFVAFRRS